MTFRKPTNITFTQMAQWVDANGADIHCDQNILCQYIYHLVVLKTQQCGYFKDLEQIDDFSLYCTTRLIQRLQKGSVKSIVNYIKTIIGPWKADYIREFCTGSAEIETADFDVFDFSDYMIDAASERDFDTYRFSCNDIIDVVRKHLQKIPRKKHSAEWTNIYISCLLTLKDRINIATELSTKELAEHNPKLMNIIIRKSKTRPPVLYHIPEYYSNYITTLVNELTHAISIEVSRSIASKVSVSACLRNMVIAASNDEEE